MLRSLSRRWFGSRRPIRKQNHRFVPSFLGLEHRVTPAVTAQFSNGILSVIGDALDNTIAVSRDAAGTILVNGGAVAIRGGPSSIGNTTLIQVFGHDGNDSISLDEANGALPTAYLFGGAGNDTLIGGSGADQLFGQAGDDLLEGRGGNDFLFGGAGNDTLVGGDADDHVFGESGDDRMIWNPGDDTDLNEGGDGIDTVEVNGGNGSEVFTATANGARVRFDRIDPAPFSIDIGTSEKLIVNANGGDDSFAATGNLAALIQITVDGGAGDDTLLGSNGADILIGGDGDDFIDGQQGADVAFLGDGDDTFQWDPGDGSDVVEGQDGFDTLLFNGSAAGEIFDLSANGDRLRFTRNVGNIVMDLDDLELVQLNALGGADVVTINDLSATAVSGVSINLAATIGGTAGDSQIDTIIVNGTNDANQFDVFSSLTGFVVSGASTLVSVAHSEGPNDALVINALGGNDALNASALPAGVVRLTLDGGADHDTIRGSAGDDIVLAGDGDDFVHGHQGNDTVLLGAGNDVFQWNPGDGSDTIEGQAGADMLLFNGSNADEAIDIVANSGRVLFIRNVASVTMDLNGIERIDFNALGGADAITLGDLSGTGLAAVNLNLNGASTRGDGQADAVTVNGTQGADAIQISGSSRGVSVAGLAAAIQVLGTEGANDRLIVNGLAGDDSIDASGTTATAVQISMTGGLGNDMLVGSPGNDQFNGGDGNDFIFMGAGDDTFVWNPGDDNDVLEGQDGFDTMIFNGANVAENFDIAANGERVRFFRNVANVVMDLNDVEGIHLNALGGADTIVVNDLSGTDVVEVNVNLAGSNGLGDAQPDTVIVNGTNGDDVIFMKGNAAGTSLFGLAAQVNITGAEAANDRLVVNALAGDDVVEGSGLTADAIQLVIDGGDGDDILIGGDGNDVILGGDGDDVLIGGPGLDILDGGFGDNVIIQ